MQVRDRYNRRNIAFHNKEHSKREAAEDGPAKFVKGTRIVLRALFNSGKTSGAAGCYAVTRTLSCKNSGAKSAPLDHVNVWNSG